MAKTEWRLVRREGRNRIECNGQGPHRIVTNDPSGYVEIRRNYEPCDCFKKALKAKLGS